MSAVLEPSPELIAQRQRFVQREREQSTTCQRLTSTAIPSRFRRATLANFITENAEQLRALKVVCGYTANFDDNFGNGRCLLICGPVGVGKTHLASGMLRSLAMAHYECRYITAIELIRWLRESWQKKSAMTEDEIIERLSKYALLVVDEVGVGYGTDAEKLQLFETINRRYNLVRPTVILSNLGISGLQQYLGERVIDRLRENQGTMLVLTGHSWRGK